MRIRVRELKQGKNDVSFSVPVDEFGQYLTEADTLYSSCGEACEVQLTVHRYDENLLIRGHVGGAYEFECARCLFRQPGELNLEIFWTLLPQTALHAERLSEEEEVELGEDDLDVSFYDGEETDLKDLIREVVLLNLEGAPTCPGECKNTDHLGMILTAEAAENQIDPRWDKLAEMRKQLLGESSEQSND